MAHDAGLDEGHEIAAMCRSLSNWGRWGGDDERGTLNLIGPHQVAQAASLVREGRMVSLARSIDPSIPDVYGPPQRLLLAGGAGPATHEPPLIEDLHHSAVEYIGLAFHGLTITHLDAPSHIAHDGCIYNGLPASSVHFAEGARHGAVTAAMPGIFTRAVLLDVPGSLGVAALPPGTPVRPEDLERCERALGVEVRPGDALILHTGAPEHSLSDEPPGKSGLHWSCLPWLAERDVALIGSDGINDVVPSGVAHVGFSLPIHVVGLVYLGLWLLDNCHTAPLAEVCRELGRWEFALSVQPLSLRGATGSPVNPVALL